MSLQLQTKELRLRPGDITRFFPPSRSIGAEARSLPLKSNNTLPSPAFVHPVSTTFLEREA